MNWVHDAGHLLSRESPITVGPGIDQINKTTRICSYCDMSRPIYTFFGNICNVCKFPPLVKTNNAACTDIAEESWSE